MSSIGDWGIEPEEFLDEDHEPFYVTHSGLFLNVYGVSAGTATITGYYVYNGRKYVDTLTVTVEE